MAADYNKTLNLPGTEFPMRASLPAREPGMLKDFQEKKIYERLCARNADKPKYVLHDGPPFSNGDIHMGTAMNKVLKDFIVRYKAMSGYNAPYVPGWDNHGMPIESAIIKKNRLDRRNMSIPEFRDACRRFAEDFVDRQRGQFIRLGVMGDWEHPYLTMDPAFEAEEVRVFGRMYEKGYIYKGRKPVYWCPSDETALAEAEIEYQDDKCESIYVKFPVKDDLGKLSAFGPLDKMFFVIWTTTTWSLPGNLAIALHPAAEYALAKAENGEIYITAEELLERTMAFAKISDYEIVGRVKGIDLEYATAKHPFMDRDSLITVADYVTMDSGTGCVHTAPCHGVDDFHTGQRYKLPHLTPIDDRGYMTDETGDLEGLFYEKAAEVILEKLRSKGMLFASEKIVHPYPHCWRCKNPIIYRATAQWFCSVEAFREAAVEACRGVKWIPAWGEERIVSMINDRADWCISRQRHWGLPIPVFYCADCGQPVCTPESIEKVAALFAAEGSNAWFEKDAAEILGDGFVCPHCGGKHFTKETDTLDGWFDSGSTHIAALEKLGSDFWPADLYLEGADQYRGWFQSSMLTAVAVRGKAPYKNVLTHGWVVDGEGKAMHKSLGNSVAPEEIIKDYGADLLRLWVASSDYQVDVRVSDNIFKQLSQEYLKIRNTCRYILGNLDGFDPNNLVAADEMAELDRWALARLNSLISRCLEAYENFEYHVISHAIHNFCVVDMSNFYLDVIKDRLYCEEKTSVARRSAQTAIYLILDAMVRLLAPILAFTAEEIWGFMTHDSSCEPESVLFNAMPKVRPEFTLSEESESKWNRLIALRDEVNLELEKARAAKVIGKPLEAEVVITADGENYDFLAPLLDELRVLLIVSSVRLERGADKIEARRAEGDKCARCWCFSPAVGSDTVHPELCPRCAGVVSFISE